MYIHMYRDCRQILCIMHDVCMCVVVLHIIFLCALKRNAYSVLQLQIAFCAIRHGRGSL